MGLLTGLVLPGLAAGTATRVRRVSDFGRTRAQLVAFSLAPAGGLRGVRVGVPCALRVVPGQLGPRRVRLAVQP